MASLIRRHGIYYLQYGLGGKSRRRSLQTDSLQLAKERLRQFQSAALRGADSPLPSHTPICEVLEAYVRHARAVKTPKSAQTEVYYLREAFGPICPGVSITSRKLTAKKRPVIPALPGQDRRRRPLTIEAACFEQITTSQVAAFISGKVQSKGLQPKTANHYRQILVRLFNWATTQLGVRMATNPARTVERYHERAPQIRFLTLPQIEEQLSALDENPQLQTMVALAIFAGLRREELVWLTAEDVDLTAAPLGILYVRAKTVQGESWQPKTRVNRAVPIGSRLRPYLDGYLRRPSRGDWFFPSPWGTRWDADNFSADLREANKKVALPWGCLDFRHTFGSQLAIKGESLYKISKLMGNSPEICRRHYAALSQECLIESVEFPTPALKIA